MNPDKQDLILPPGAKAPPGATETKSMAIFELLDYIVNEVKFSFQVHLFSSRMSDKSRKSEFLLKAPIMDNS